MGMKKEFTYFSLTPADLKYFCPPSGTVESQKTTVNSRLRECFNYGSELKKVKLLQHNLKHAYFELENISKMIFLFLAASLDASKATPLLTSLEKEVLC